MNIFSFQSKNLVTGGIDVLETVGKKAFDFMEDHDPGIHKSKEVLFDRGDKPNLSQILKEAKESADYQAEMEKESEEARKSHFGFLFDEFQGYWFIMISMNTFVMFFNDYLVAGI